MTRIIQLFGLKGEREYVHGTDIFNQLLFVLSKDAQKLSDLDITFTSRLTNTACVWQFAEHDAELEHSSAPCRGNYRLDSGDNYFTLTPDAIEGARERSEYNENDVTADIELTEVASTAVVNQNYTFIENLVALNKRHHNHFHPLTKKQWLFAKISLRKVPHSVESIAIVNESMILNRLSKRKIVVDGEDLGFIFFSVG